MTGKHSANVPKALSNRLGFLCACLLVLSFVGCNRTRARAEHSTITVLYCCDERVLGPYWRYNAQFLVFLPLVTRNARGELEGRLAESWEHSADYRTWAIHLRRGIRWHDGVPVTAYDIKFTLGLMSDPQVGWGTPGAFSVIVLDDNTYTITFHKHTDYKPLDDYQVYYPKHLLEPLDRKQLYEWEFWTHPVGNGPYRYVRHVPKTMMEFRTNPDYFRGKPKIERAVLKFRPSGDPSPTELLSGNVDVITYANRADLLKLARDPRFWVYERITPTRVRAIAWNQHLPLFRDPKIRRALTLAINRRELVQVLNLPDWTPLFDVLPTPDQLRRPRGDFPEPLPHDPERAKALLEESGWHDEDSDGVRERAGKALRFAALVARTQGLDSAAVYIQAQLRKVGIQMDVQILEEAAADERVRAGQFEAAVFIFYTNLFRHLEYFGEHSPMGYGNPRVIALLQAAEAAWNPDDVERIYRQLWPVFQADLPITFLSPVIGTVIAHRRVQGLSSPWRTNPMYFMDDVWLEE